MQNLTDTLESMVLFLAECGLDLMPCRKYLDIIKYFKIKRKENLYRPFYGFEKLLNCMGITLSLS